MAGLRCSVRECGSTASRTVAGTFCDQHLRERHPAEWARQKGVQGVAGRTVPRLWTPPLIEGPAGPCGCGCALTEATSLGFRCVAFAEQVLGIRLDPWQRWFLIHALEVTPDGSFRFRTVLLLVARQNGKTTVVKALILWAMYTGRVSVVVGTAQDRDIARRAWN